MEVKTPLDVDQGFLIKEFGDKRVRHSKYCEAVKKLLYLDNIVNNFFYLGSKNENRAYSKII